MITFIKIFLFVITLYLYYLVGERYRKRNKINYESKKIFLYESQSLIDWYKGSMETKYYWGYWLPLIPFLLLLYLSS